MGRYNKIYTAKEYMAQGFTADEVPLITRHDTLLNMDIDGLLTEDEKDEMFVIQKILGI